MPIGNIIDKRKQKYQYMKINAVIEPTWHDNSCAGADQAPCDAAMDKQWIGYAEREHISLLEAIVWASSHKDLVTLYLYDQDDGLYLVKDVPPLLALIEKGNQT